MPLYNPISNSDLIEPGTNNLYMTPAEKAAIANGTAINDGAITLSKTNFIVTGKNLFNKATATLGYFVNQTNGLLSSSASYSASDYISVTGNTQYTRSVDARVAFYNINKVCISGIVSSGNKGTLTTPANACYMRCTCLYNTNTFQVELGAERTNYEPFGYKINNEIPITYKGYIPIPSLPPVIYGIVGKEVNVYFQNITDVNLLDYQLSATSEVGVTQNERWTFIPEIAGTNLLSINITQNFINTLMFAQSSVVIKAANVGNGVTKKALIIGDSTIANSAVTNELVVLFGSDVMNLTLIGTKGTSPSLHEGISGGTVSYFYTSESSTFVSGGVFNFANYATVNNCTDLDYVLIDLGINDVFGYPTDAGVNEQIASVIANYESMVTAITAYNTSIVVGVCITIPPAATQDAFGHDYSAGWMRWRYKRNNSMFAKALIKQFSGRTASRIYLIPLNTNLDTVNNMPTETVTANSRNSTEIVRQTNGVHPAASGYQQIADTMYYWIKSFES